jgi:hypothetical protein
MISTWATYKNIIMVKSGMNKVKKIGRSTHKRNEGMKGGMVRRALIWIKSMTIIIRLINILIMFPISI